MSHPIALRDGSGAMFDRIARRYDLLNRVLSLGVDRRWRRAAVAAARLQPGSKVLDVATGTADVALELRRAGASVVGVDPSEEMLAVGREKVAVIAAGDVQLEVGSAESLPYPDNSFDAVTIAFGIRNVPDRLLGLREMARVCRPDGRVVVLELNEPRGGLMGSLARFHIHHVVPWVGAVFSGSSEYRYLQRSIAAFPPPDEFAEMMREAGLEVLRQQRLTFGVCGLHVAKPRKVDPAKEVLP